MGHLLLEVGIALLLVTVASLLAYRFKLSIIPFIIILGMLVGPHAPKIGFIDLTFIESQQVIAFLGQLGVLFLLFYLGIEFSVSKLIRSGRDLVIGGTIYVLLNFVLGLLYAFFIDFGFYEALMIAGMMSVSSTAIVAKVLVDLKRTGNPETELILGMILFDDLFLAVFLSIMSGLLLGDATSPGGFALSVGKSLGYMLLFFFIARKGPPVINKLLKITSNEIFIIVVLSALVFVAGISETFNVAPAIAALLFGLALSETEHSKKIEHMIIPFRDFFGAIFFFSFGLSINPLTLWDMALYSMGAVLITILANFLAGMAAGYKAGLTPKSSLNIGLTIVARGEFSIIVINVGIAAGLDPHLQTFSALYVLTLAILGPMLARWSKYIYNVLNMVFRWSQPVEKAKKIG